VKYNKRQKYSQAEINFLQCYYPTKGGRYCSKKLNRTLSSVHNVVDRYKIKIDKTMLSSIFEDVYKKENNKYNVNADLFITPSNPSVIYTMGLLWADGTINIQKNYLREICLKSTFPDGDEFYSIMSSFGKWNYYKYNTKTKPSIQIKTNNRPLVDFLLSVDYKSKTEFPADKILKIIPEKLQHYWFRGLFDGDGSLYIKNRTIQVVLSGPLQQDWSYLTILLDKLKVSYAIKKIQSYKGTHSFVRFTGAINCKKFLNYIYNNAKEDKIYLSRKYIKYLSI
jgi:hypothetical protein